MNPEAGQKSHIRYSLTFLKTSALILITTIRFFKFDYIVTNSGCYHVLSKLLYIY